MSAEPRHPNPKDRAAAAQWARALLAKPDMAILDTETTGLGGDDEVLQVAVLDRDGRVLMATLLKPTGPIPPEATAIHGIGDDLVWWAPAFPEVRDRLEALLKHRSVVVYNAAYDRRLLAQTAVRHQVPELDASGWDCAMLQFAAFVGEWNDYRRGYRWQKLPPLPGVPSHDAAADCLACLAVLRRMASGGGVHPSPEDDQEAEVLS